MASDSSPRPRPRFRLGVLRPIGEASLTGLALGLADSRYAGEFHWAVPAYLLAGLVLGFRHAGRAWPCWVPLGVGLYIAHIVAIALGRQPPYVEESYLAARQTFFVLPLAGLALALGAGVRWVLALAGWFPRKDGSPVRLWPRTIAGMIAFIAKLAVTWSLTQWALFGSGTQYAPGFSESRFQQVYVGMTTDQVEALLGPPIDKLGWGTPGVQRWAYTNQVSATSNFHRRWVFVEGGKVATVVNDYWYD